MSKTNETIPTTDESPEEPKTTVAAIGVSKHYTVRSKSGKVFMFRKKHEVDALTDVSLLARAGESIGVLGPNGSGKSTLLRMIAGTEMPTRGSVHVSQVPTLLGVSAALQQRLSGRANMRLGLLAMGLTPDEAEELEPDIAEFADIGDAIDRPMNTYSSGMAARLKFGISTAVKSDILLIDEALATGDAAFADKARERMESFLDDAGTVFLVSHGANVIHDHCQRAIWLDNGRVVADGDAETVARDYARWSRHLGHGEPEDAENILQSYREKYRAPRLILSTYAHLMLTHRYSPDNPW